MTFFNDEIQALKYLHEVQHLHINDDTYEIPPIRLAIKYESWNVVEYLVKNGAYYIGEKGYANNLVITKGEKEKEKFRDRLTNKEIKPNLVFDLRKLNSKEYGSQDTINRISTYFKWIRYKPFLLDLEIQKRMKKPSVLVDYLSKHA